MNPKGRRPFFAITHAEGNSTTGKVTCQFDKGIMAQTHCRQALFIQSVLAGLGSGVDGAPGNAEGAPPSPTAAPARTGAGGQARGVPMRQRHELLFPRFFLSWGREEAKEIDSKEEERATVEAA